MNASEFDEQIDALYGNVEWSGAAGILHVAAVAGDPACAIAIGPGAPASETDRFVLGFARARADLILTSGAILRAEPNLVHCYAESERMNRVFAQWRERVLGKREPPALAVLSRSGNFPTEHPALLAASSGLIYTTPAGHERLGRSRCGRLEVRVSEDTDCLATEVSAAIEESRRLLDARTILIEAGPTISSTLYPEPNGEAAGSFSSRSLRIDELLLSRFEGTLEERAVGPAFISRERVRAGVGEPVSAVHREEESGRWCFERYCGAS